MISVPKTMADRQNTSKRSTTRPQKNLPRDGSIMFERTHTSNSGPISFWDDLDFYLEMTIEKVEPQKSVSLSVEESLASSTQ